MLSRSEAGVVACGIPLRTLHISSRQVLVNRLGSLAAFPLVLPILNAMITIARSLYKGPPKRDHFPDACVASMLFSLCSPHDP